MFDEEIGFIRAQFGGDGPLPLHEPRFRGAERRYVADAIDSTFVSSTGRYVDGFAAKLTELTGARHAVPMVNGTAALHLALHVAGVGPGDEVLTQTLSFVATANAIHYCGAHPVFLDVERRTAGLSTDAVATFIDTACERRRDGVFNRRTGRRIAACVPMHTFGHPCDIEGLVELCARIGVPVVEDAAESLGSTLHGRHTGTFGLLGALSFNGNKIATCGGGGAVITDDATLGPLLKHLSTTAKKPHRWAYFHDRVGFNYRMPNLNAALGLAQLEQLDDFVADKRALAKRYIDWFGARGYEVLEEPEGARSNYWLNGIVLTHPDSQQAFLEACHAADVYARPVWQPLHELPMYAHCERGELTVADDLAQRIVNLPSSVRP